MKSVAVIGAGPAGLFAARELANAGVNVALINRDIKPGGLAEYGIYKDKYKMKNGLRMQFKQILATPSIHYFGNVVIGEHGQLTLAELKELGFDAVLVTAGAQGTKWQGLPGEDLPGVYHAKNVVYHYNKLPPYATQEFRIGKRVAIIGMGNVMIDVAHFLLDDLQAEKVISVGRRGPAEVKFDKKEMESICGNIDMDAIQAAVDEATPLMHSLGQDPQKTLQFFNSVLECKLKPFGPGKFSIKFLASPVEIIGDQKRGVTGLKVEENTLIQAGADTKARGTGQFAVMDVDTVIFAIGDTVDPQMGLPTEWGEFIKRKDPRFPVEGVSYESVDEANPELAESIFVGGWSRKASEGLVGYARKDGINAAKAVLQYLATVPEITGDPVRKLDAVLKEQKVRTIGTSEVTALENIEKTIAAEKNLQEYKFDRNQDMLEIIEKADKVIQ